MRRSLDCVDWVAHGYEIVQSIYPGWKFTPADTAACNAMHGALLIGKRHPIAPRKAEWLRELPAFEIDLYCNGVLADRGRASNVLDGPVSALRHLVELLAQDALNPPLAAGDIVTTGTLTRALAREAGRDVDNAAARHSAGRDRLALRLGAHASPEVSNMAASSASRAPLPAQTTNWKAVK